MGKKKLEVFMPELSAAERKEWLETNCHKRETRTYNKPLTDGEIRQRQDKYIDNDIEVDRLNDELKAIKDEYKGKTTPIEKQNKTLRMEIKTKHKQEQGEVYLMPDFETGYMHTYNAEGIELDVRKLYPEERQMRPAFNLRKVEGGMSEGATLEAGTDEDDE